MDIENVILFNSYRSIWNSIFHWLSKGERSDLKRLAFSGQGRGSRGFKNFFDLTFKLTSGSLTNRLNPGPKAPLIIKYEENPRFQELDH
ncbi:hypothetical protein KEM48_007628 [Puccinia striiformis f. sp. tritici PST-130]|nr:hypothetical protein H4Q26_007756 [Puccinia striiformis f. sp. tritici PST-130]KAI9621699.1 hypothetical protein KEM48_007628 [Puccinia striiformis f. sp. tritici PST-130]